MKSGHSARTPERGETVGCGGFWRGRADSKIKKPFVGGIPRRGMGSAVMQSLWKEERPAADWGKELQTAKKPVRARRDLGSSEGGTKNTVT